ncbi:uncharacterized protein [Pituophis catenifer annectens]|uniref:uncharacterized protein isoform X2 n=1 Tax=Pituophis catenifer annectens TaxID=94852 RepID=UPI00399611A8
MWISVAMVKVAGKISTSFFQTVCRVSSYRVWIICWSFLLEFCCVFVIDWRIMGLESCPNRESLTALTQLLTGYEVKIPAMDSGRSTPKRDVQD